METSSPAPLDSNLRNQLIRYGLGAAAVAAAVTPTGSDAAIVFTNAGDVTGDSIFFDLQGGLVSNTAGTAATDFHLYMGNPTKPYIAAYTGTSNAVLAAYGGGFPIPVPPFFLYFPNNAPRLSSTDTIGGPGQTFFSDATFDQGPGQWSLGARGFIGLDLISGGDNFYGWADITWNDKGGINNDAFILHGFAFDNVPNEAINLPTSAVPEGGSTALLLILGAAGAVGLRELRARRQTAA